MFSAQGFALSFPINTVGGRDSEYAMTFMDDLCSRLSNRVQGYSPAECIGIRKEQIKGNPDPEGTACVLSKKMSYNRKRKRGQPGTAVPVRRVRRAPHACS
jgi:hypothetical protein